MRKYFCYILLLISSAVESQSRSPCDIPQELESAYVDQIRSLALDQMLNSGTLDTNSIHILEPYYLPIAEALAGIYNSPFTEEVDSIFNMYCINNQDTDESNGYRSKAIYVTLDTTVSWTESWENNLDTSGNTFIDSLLFDVTYSVHSLFLFNTIKRLEFIEVLNLSALIKLLESVEGIVSANQVASYGGGTYILHHKEGDDHNFKFILGWDDCPSGCISNRVWEFQSNTSTCDAQFVRAYGTPVTFWYNDPPFAPNCNLTSNELDISNEIKFTLYPNPVSDVLHIESEKDINFLSIYNIMGKALIHKAVNGVSINENISNLVPGFYVLILNKHIVSWFIKA